MAFTSIDEDLIDTVFNENDYRNFISTLEKFAKAIIRTKRVKPTLEMFNAFIKDKKIWGTVKAIRFQDLPANDNKEFLLLRGFYYKKRIQFAVFDKGIIGNFAPFVTKECLD